MTAVKCPETLATIGSRAFADCPDLKAIYIPEATTGIARDAFGDNPELVIYGEDESYAEFYAKTYGYVFIVN